MKLEVGMYVRTKNGYISQYKYYDTTNAYMEKLLCIPLSNGTFANIEDVVKAGYNIIDILKVGDYVNGDKVNEVVINEFSSYVILEGIGHYVEDLETIEAKDIETIVTKEQFEQMSYKVRESR